MLQGRSKKHQLNHRHSLFPLKPERLAGSQVLGECKTISDLTCVIGHSIERSRECNGSGGTWWSETWYPTAGYI